MHTSSTDGVEYFLTNNTATGGTIANVNITAGQIKSYNFTFVMTAGQSVMLRSGANSGNIDSDALGSKWFIYQQGAVANNFSISATDEYTNVSLSNFSAQINGVNYSTSTGTITTQLLANATSLYSVFLFAANNSGGAFFNKTYSNVNLTSNLAATLVQSEVTLGAYEKITNNSLTGTFKRDGTTVSGIQRIDAATYNFSFSNASYYQADLNYSVPALFNSTLNITGVYTTKLNLSAKNAFSNQPINNFTGWIYYNATGYNETFSTSTGNVILNLITGSYYAFIDPPGYSLSSSNYQQKTIGGATDTMNFTLYSQNSIYISIFDEDTNLPITQNITVTTTGNSTEIINYTTSGTLFLTNLTDGSYSIKFVGGNYTLKTYVVTVADRSFQTLNAFLSSSSQNVVLTFLDFNTGATLSDVTITMYRLINATWTIVETKSSDISGRAQFQYTLGVKYKFDASLSNYLTNIFYLDPIIFSAYNVRMNQITTLTQDVDYLGVSISYYPTTFFVNRTNNFTWMIESPIGIIESYNLTIGRPGGTSFFSGNSTIGQEFATSFNITGAQQTDKVNISYCYDISIGTPRCFSFQYAITGVYGNQSYQSNQDNTFGLGIFERIIISTVIVIVVAGFIGIAGGPLAGAAIGLIIFAFLSRAGFVPWWAIAPSLLAGFFLIARRSSE